MEGILQTPIVTHVVSENVQLPETLKLEWNRSMKDQMKKGSQSALSICRKGTEETHPQTHIVFPEEARP